MAGRIFERKTGWRMCSSRNGSKRCEEKDTGLRAEKRTGRKPVPKLSSGQARINRGTCFITGARKVYNPRPIVQL